MSERRKELLRKIEKLMKMDYPDLVGNVKQVNVHFDSRVSVHITKDRMVQYG